MNRLVAILIVITLGQVVQAEDFIVSRRDNLVPFSPAQLQQLGYSRPPGQSYWSRPVMVSSPSGQCQSSTGDCSDSHESATSGSPILLTKS